MKNTVTLLDAEARRAVHKGVNAIYQPVKRTLGPQAKTALIYRTYNRGPRATDDGVTVAEVQEPKDPHVNLAANFFKEMCKRTVEKVGDGTTTTAVIGGKLYNDVYELLDNKSTMVASSEMGSGDVRNKIRESAEKVKAEILKRSKKVETLEDLERICTISVKDPELGKLVAKMAQEVGVDGYIDVVEGYKGEIETEVIQGFRFQAKPGAKAFVNHKDRYQMIAEKCPVILTNYILDNAGESARFLRELNEKGITKIVVIAPSFSNNVLQNMALAVPQGYHIFPVAVPGMRTEQFEDVAVYMGAKFFDSAKSMRLSTLTEADLGYVERLIVKDTDVREEAVALGGRGTQEVTGSKVEGGETKTFLTTPIKERIETLKAQLEEQQQDNFKKLFARRIASMSSAVGVIRVGDSTQATALYRKLKLEDCVYAAKAALRGGYSLGGGLELKEIAEAVLDKDDMIFPALLHPYELIQASASGGVLEIGPDVIDPTEAIFWAVEHATSVVAQLVTVEVLTPEVDDMPPGDGYMAIAKMVGEMVIIMKRHLGQLQESQEEQERDRLGGLTTGEKVMLDQG